jgi:hypothetical protein
MAKRNRTGIYKIFWNDRISVFFRCHVHNSKWKWRVEIFFGLVWSSAWNKFHITASFKAIVVIVVLQLIVSHLCFSLCIFLTDIFLRIIQSYSCKEYIIYLIQFQINKCWTTNKVVKRLLKPNTKNVYTSTAWEWKTFFFLVVQFKVIGLCGVQRGLLQCYHPDRDFLHRRGMNRAQTLYLFSICVFHLLGLLSIFLF